MTTNLNYNYVTATAENPVVGAGKTPLASPFSLVINLRGPAIAGYKIRAMDFWI